LTLHVLPPLSADSVPALGVTGDTEHAEVVLATLDDPEIWVREHAARAYERMAVRLDLPGLGQVDG